MIPSFLRPTEAQKILLVGKSINFLREVCKQPLSEFVIPTTTDQQLANQELDLNKRIMKRLDETYESTSVRLLAIMTHEYKLNLHFKVFEPERTTFTKSEPLLLGIAQIYAPWPGRLCPLLARCVGAVSIF